MRTDRRIARWLFAAFFLSAATTVEAGSSRSRPNFLVIVADDLGYSDVGSFGSEIPTPNLDQLAKRGVRFTNFHTYAACSPSRAALLTGASPAQAGFATMAGDWTDETRGKVGYETHLTNRVATIGEILSAAGYRTMLVGKWDMGGVDDPAQRPGARGFHQHFALIQGAGSHFDSRGVFPDIPTVMYVENDKPVTLPNDFYTSRSFADKLISFLSDASTSQPFFAMLNFTAPHWPLQAPDEAIAAQRHNYDSGYEAVREARLTRMREMNIIDPDFHPAPFDPNWPSWSSLPDKMRSIEERRMEIYAAMVSIMDQQIGRVLQSLKTTGQLDNTVILFLSDNGADGGNPLDFGGPDWYRWAEQERDLRYSQMGRPGSHVWYGPQWAHVSNTPFRLDKGFATEGGTRTPLIVSGPFVNGHGAINRTFVHIGDIMPTVLNLAGVKPPKGKFAGRPIAPIEGKSIRPLLADPDRERLHSNTEFFAWELWARRAGRLGQWKIVWQNPPWGPKERWALYNVVRDPAEQQDLALQETAIARKLIKRWDNWAQAEGVVPIPYFPSDWTNVRTHFSWTPPDMDSVPSD